MKGDTVNEAGKMRRLVRKHAKGEQKKADQEAASITRSGEFEKNRAHTWFETYGRKEYLKKIKEAAKEGKKEVRIEIAGVNSQRDDIGDPYCSEIFRLFEKFLTKEGFRFERFSVQVGWNAMYECREGPTHGGLIVKW